MDKSNFLKTIAETGYNVGFGAKKHFATFDIVRTVPSLLNFASLAIAVYALVVEPLNHKVVAASLVVSSLLSILVSTFASETKLHEEIGVKLTLLFNKLRDLCRDVESQSDAVFFEKSDTYFARFSDIEAEFYNLASPKQILLSDWYAHYKFFWQQKIQWIENHRPFSLLRDKVPLSFMFVLVCLFILLIAFLVCRVI